MRPIGATGTKNYGGFITSEELNRDWTGQALYRTVDRMVRSDPVVRAALMMVMLPIAEAEWTVEPAGTEPEDLAVAEFVRRALLEHLDWRKVVWQAIPARYGHAVLEETYEAAEWSLSVPDAEGEEQELPTRTFWVPAAYQPRLGRTIWRWIVDSTGRLEAIEQQRLDPANGQYSVVQIPTSQLVVVTNEQEGDDYTGISILRSAYRSWYTKEKLELIDAIAKERGGAGVFVGYVPDKDWDAEADGMEENLRALRANEESFLVLRVSDNKDEPGQSVEALDMKASSQADCMPSLDYHCRQILWSVLGAWQYLGQGAVGSRATAEAQDDPFYLGLNYMAGTIASAFNRQVVQRLVALNFNTDRFPTLRCGEIAPLDVGAWASGVAQVITAGGIEHDESLEAALRAKFDLPDKLITEDEDEDEDEPEETPESEPPSPDDEPTEPDDPPAPEGDATSSEDAPEADPTERALSAGVPPGEHGPSDAPSGRWRALTPAEQHVSLDAIDATVEEQRQRYEALCRDEAVRIASHFTSQLAGLADDADLTRPAEMQDALASQIEDVLAATAQFGRVSVRQELASQRPTALATLPVPDSPQGLVRWLQRSAKASARRIVDRLRGQAETLASQPGPGGGPPKPERALAALTSAAESGLRAEAVATVSQALSAGRRAETDAAAAEGLATTAQYSAILDTGTCGPCGALDGEMYEVGSPEYEDDYPPLADCEGGTRCRCIMILIADDEVPSER